MASLFSAGRKTKTEVICAIAKYVAYPVDQSQPEANTYRQWKAREGAHERGIILVLLMRCQNGAGFLSQGNSAKTQ